MQEKEVWKDVKNYEGIYEISNLGRVKSLGRYIKSCHGFRLYRKEKFLKQGVTCHGYEYVVLSIDKVKQSKTIHILIAESFMGHNSKTSNLIVDHKDNIKLNNNLNNLQLITNRKNCSKDRKNKTSRYTGVSWNKCNKKWLSTINIGGKQTYLGCFKDEYKAHLAYQNKLSTIKTDYK